MKSSCGSSQVKWSEFIWGIFVRSCSRLTRYLRYLRGIQFWHLSASVPPLSQIIDFEVLLSASLLPCLPPQQPQNWALCFVLAGAAAHLAWARVRFSPAPWVVHQRRLPGDQRSLFSNGSMACRDKTSHCSNHCRADAWRVQGQGPAVRHPVLPFWTLGKQEQLDVDAG